MIDVDTPPRPARPATPIFDNLPLVLRQLPQWVVWNYGFRDGRWTKIPYQPRQPHRKARAGIPATWADFAVARRVYFDHGFDGIGFEFSETDPYAGIDLDNCLINGEVQEWALPLIREFQDGYAEISPSGNGIKFIVVAKLPGPGTRRSNYKGIPGAAVELYDSGRFFTLTGDVWGGVE